MTIQRITLILILMVGIIGLCGEYVQAQVTETYYFCTDNGEWEADGDNFFLSFDGTTCSNAAPDDPESDDKVVIIPNITCIVDFSDTIADLEVRSGASLEFPSGNSLTIRGLVGDDVSTITGTVRLQDDTSSLHFTQRDQTIEGAGSIIGEIAGARVLIGDEVTLTNQTTITGILTITEVSGVFNGTFVNQGTVEANASGTLSVNAETVDDGSAGVWKVSASGAILQFDPRLTSNPMEGDFTVVAGTLDVEDPGIDTTGVLTFTGGTIDCGGLTGTNVAKFTES